MYIHLRSPFYHINELMSLTRFRNKTRGKEIKMNPFQQFRIQANATQRENKELFPRPISTFTPLVLMQVETK